MSGYSGPPPSEIYETSERGNVGVAVFIQDQTTKPLSVPFLKERSPSTLAIDVAAGDRVINLSPGHGAVVGDILELSIIGGSDFLQSEILSINVDAITIDQPSNRDYAISETFVTSSIQSMLIDGSVTPQVFSVLPLPGQSADVVRIIVEITGSSAMDFEKFGSNPALVNGCVLRVKRQDGSFFNLFNFKTNGDFIRQAFDYAFQVNNANNVRAFTSRTTWGGQSKHGVVIRLEGDLEEELQIVVQDNLTGGDNTEFRLQAQGHAVQS